MSKYKQGIYKPVNKEKYIGNTYPIYRSGWELKFFRWADKNENILNWGSENIIVPYINPLDGLVHRYFVDNFIIFKNSKNEKQKILIEIKPSTQLNKPQPGNKKKRTILYEQKTWVTNQAKWEAAEKWAKKKGYKFIILTEKELFI
jgi:hypothetical protein